jgi:arylsulfatase A-like enzyme
MPELPAWVAEWNRANVDKYWNREWKDASGKTLRSTARPQSTPGAPSPSFYDVIGHTPFANDHELEFARELITREKLGQGSATDLLAISLSANDIVGHQVGPDAPEMAAFILALDRQLADFFSYLGRQFGLANIWIALSADHGDAPTLEMDRKLRIPGTWIDPAQLSRDLAARIGKSTAVRHIDWPIIFLADDAFGGQKEAAAENAVGQAVQELGLATGFFSRAQLAAAEVPNDELGHRFLHSYSPYGGWWVMAVPRPFSLTSKTGADHGAPWSYDMHVPLVFMGLPFRPGVYRSPTEPVDLAVTLASLLGINAPSAAVGRVLTEALAAPHPPASMVPAGARK